MFNRQYTYIVCKNIIYLDMLLESDRKPSLWQAYHHCFEASTSTCILYLPTMHAYTAVLCMQKIMLHLHTNIWKFYCISYCMSTAEGPSWPWSYGSQIYNYIYNQCLSPLKLWFWILLMARCTQYNIMW